MRINVLKFNHTNSTNDFKKEESTMTINKTLIFTSLILILLTISITLIILKRKKRIAMQRKKIQPKTSSYPNYMREPGDFSFEIAEVAEEFEITNTENHDEITF